MVREMFLQGKGRSGKVLAGKNTSGEVSIGEVSGRGIVRSGKCLSGRYSSEKCHWGNCLVGELSGYQNDCMVHNSSEHLDLTL